MSVVTGAAIPLSGIDIGPAERRAVLSVLASRRLALGPAAAGFERLMARRAGRRYAVAVSSGTAGLHLVVRALGVGPGDEVVTTPFSFVASANCALYEGAAPVFADVDADTLCIDPAAAERAVTRRTRAIVGVDVFGHPADWPGLARVARRHRLALVEDSCEALGARLGPRPCGSFGAAAVFAFYPNKQMTTGEGGMVVTDSRRIAGQCRSEANQGRRLGGGAWLEHVRLGFNYRLDELSCALGLTQLLRLDGILARRRRVAGQYQQLLAGSRRLRTPFVAPGAEWSPFVYVVRLADEFERRDRDRVLARLRGQGIECGDYFRPIHLQPFYRRRFGYGPGDFPRAEAAGDRTIALPFFGRMTGAQVRQVAAALLREVEGGAANRRRPGRKP